MAQLLDRFAKALAQGQTVLVLPSPTAASEALEGTVIEVTHVATPSRRLRDPRNGQVIPVVRVRVNVEIEFEVPVASPNLVLPMLVIGKEPEGTTVGEAKGKLTLTQ